MLKSGRSKFCGGPHLRNLLNSILNNTLSHITLRFRPILMGLIRKFLPNVDSSNVKSIKLGNAKPKN